MMERYIICRKFGAQVHLTAGAAGGSMVLNMFEHLTSLLKNNPSYWSPLQFENPDNPATHVETTGPEIWDQTDGEVDYFVAGAGTGGTMAGVGPWLKAQNPRLINVVVEPCESRVLAGAPSDKHTVVGIGAGIHLKFIEELAPGRASRVESSANAATQRADCIRTTRGLHANCMRTTRGQPGATASSSSPRCARSTTVRWSRACARLRRGARRPPPRRAESPHSPYTRPHPHNTRPALVPLPPRLRRPAVVGRAARRGRPLRERVVGRGDRVGEPAGGGGGAARGALHRCRVQGGLIRRRMQIISKLRPPIRLRSHAPVYTRRRTSASQVACDIASLDEAAGKTIVVIFPSSGIRYVTHPMWAATKAEAAFILAPPPDFSNAPPLLRWRSEDYVPPPK